MKIEHLLLLFGLLLLACDNDFSSPNVTTNNIRRVELGMSVNQVVEILGLPFEVSAKWRTHVPNESFEHLDVPTKSIKKDSDLYDQLNYWQRDTVFCCSAYHNDQLTNGFLLRYSNDHALFKDYPMVWIHLNRNLNVETVYVKKYSGFNDNDIEVYSLSEDYGLNESPEFELLFR